jgi:hypothetical protein
VKRFDPEFNPLQRWKLWIGFDEIQLEEAPVGKVVTLKVRETLRKKDYTSRLCDRCRFITM